jgi:hypothetical protein
MSEERNKNEQEQQRPRLERSSPRTPFEAAWLEILRKQDPSRRWRISRRPPRQR